LIDLIAGDDEVPGMAALPRFGRLEVDRIAEPIGGDRHSAL
jgi:hypothetical protein